MGTAAWMGWLAALLATPFFLADPLFGVAHSNRYVFVALGLLVGCMAAEAPRTGPLARRFAPACAIIGAAAALVSLIPEWIALPAYCWPNPSNIHLFVPLWPFQAVLAAQPYLLFVSAGACALTGCRLMSRAALQDKGHEGRVQDAPKAPRLKGFALAAPLLIFAFGFFRMSWSAILDRLASSFPHLEAACSLAAYALSLSSLAFFLLVAWLIRAAALLIARNTPKEEAVRRKAYLRLLGALSLGMLFWNLTTRVVPLLGGQPAWSDADTWTRAAPLGAPAFGILLSLGLLACGIAWSSSSWRRDPARPASTSAGKGAQGIPAEGASQGALASGVRERCLQAGLTARERAAIDHFLSGSTSAQSALAMGVKPHTVRTYLQRAYKKLGVSTGKELLSLAGDQAADREGGGARANAGRARASAPACAQAALMAVAACLLLLPFGGEEGLWGSGRQLLAGASSALLLYGLTARYARWAAQAGVGDAGRLLAPLQKHGMGAAGMVAALSIIALAASSAYLLSHEGAFPAALSFASFVSAFALVLGLCAVGSAWLAALDSKPDRATALYVAVCAGLFAASAAWRYLEEARLFLATLLAVLVGALALSGTRPACTDTAPLDERAARPPASLSSPLLHGLLAAVCATYGFAWQEAWRSPDPSSPLPLLVAFALCGIVAATACLWLVKGARSGARIGLASLAACAASLSLGYRSLTIALSFILLSFVLLEAFKKTVVSKADLLTGMIALGCGCLAGLVAMDMVGDVLSLRDGAALSFLGGLNAARTLLQFSEGALLIASLALLGLFYRQLSEQTRFQPLFAVAAQADTAEKLQGLLRLRGLNETQTAVCLCIAQGLTSKQAAEKLNYSPGTVNTARAAVYRFFKVHSRAELLAALSEATRALRSSTGC